MMNWQAVMGIVLTFGCVHLLMADGARMAQAGGAIDHQTALVREQVTQLGSGADVRLKLKDGAKVKGEIGAIGEDGFEMRQAGRSGARIDYTDVSEVKLAKLSYRAEGQPDPAAVRRVVAALGPGKHVAVKTVGGVTYRGHLRKAGEDAFTLLPDQTSSEVTIAYADVARIGKNLSPGGTIAVLAAVLAAVLIVAMVLNKDETPKVQI